MINEHPKFEGVFSNFKKLGEEPLKVGDIVILSEDKIIQINQEHLQKLAAAQEVAKVETEKFIKELIDE